MITKWNEKTLDNLLRPPTYRKIKLGGKISYVISDNTEGIELIGQSEIKPFVVVENTRNYISPQELKTLALQSLFKPQPEIPKETQKPENKDNLPAEQNNNNNSSVLIPDEISEKFIEKLKKQTTFQRMLLFQKTAPELIKHKPKGSKQIAYVEGNVMQQEANIAFLFNWSDKIEGFHFSENAVACYGFVAVEIDGKTVTHSAVGIDLQEYTKAEKKPVFSQEELMKNAHTDMIKKALSKFGFNGDVYRGEV